MRVEGFYTEFWGVLQFWGCRSAKDRRRHLQAGGFTLGCTVA